MFRKILAVGVCGALLSGCSPLIFTMGGTAAAGTALVRNENGITGAISDSSLQTKINAKLLEQAPEIMDRVELSVKHGNVVVIGYMKNEEQCRRAMHLIRQIAGPNVNVFGELKINSIPTAKIVAADSNITSKIKSAMAFDSNVYALNYDVTTVRGVVYICGLAQTKFERDVVLNCARTTPGVEKVVSYIFINRYKNMPNRSAAQRDGTNHKIVVETTSADDDPHSYSEVTK